MSSKPAIPFILFGAFLIGVDAVSIWIGSVPVRYGSGIRLEEQPEMFWLMTGVYFTGGVIMIGMGLWRALRR